MIADDTVVVARSARPDYGALDEPVAAPELPSGRVTTQAGAAVRGLFALWGLDGTRYGRPEWNPLGAVIAPGSRVVLKPNWVFHRNRSGAGMDCLVTHASVIEAVLEYVTLARAAAAVVGDAPIQGCDFAALLAATGMPQVLERFAGRLDVRLADFRRTVLDGTGLGASREENRRGEGEYVRFDLAGRSLLEPLAADAEKFRVTMYNPDLLHRTHAPGRHQYLIAREVVDADVVISLPKLKTHSKAGITGALKNLIGINGNKEFLPHHRKGGASTGGDCYGGGSWLKGRAEDLLDAANRNRAAAVRVLLGGGARYLNRAACALGEEENLEGSWYGNDTIWRTCLDLQRILRYGRADGSLDETARRTVLTITDAIVAGEGEGPLANTPVPAGIVTGAVSTAAAEWVHAKLMGFAPARVPLVREAFGGFAFPLADFAPSRIRVLSAAGDIPAEDVAPVCGRAFVPARGWAGHCEAALP